MESEQVLALLETEQKIIGDITGQSSLDTCLKAICLQIESLLAADDAISAILLLCNDKIEVTAAPTLPNELIDKIQSFKIGPSAQSSSSAMYLRKQIVIPDISKDASWENHEEIARAYQLKSSWYVPLISSQQELLGNLAIYYRKTTQPTALQQQFINKLTDLAVLAIERVQSQQREDQLLNELTTSSEKFKALVSVLPDLAMIIDSDGLYVDIYGADTDLLYATADNVLGKYVQEVLPPATAESVMDIIEKTITTKNNQVFEYDLKIPKGSVTFEGRTSYIDHYSPNSPDKKHVLWIARDITEKKQTELKIEKLAFYDPLTALPNRRLLVNRLEQVIEKVARDKEVGALLYLDLDDFKRINDCLGHETGDRLLCQVAQRIDPIIRATDSFARLGGDEFVVLMEKLNGNREAMAQEAKSVAQRLLILLRAPFELDNAEYKIGASIGICLLEDELMNANEALRRADAAMYKAKHNGGGHLAFFDPELQQIIERRLNTERNILAAIDQQQFTAFFQPQVDFSGQIIGAEALIRWQHPQLGFICPSEFIPIAEQCGLIHQLQEIVLEQSCDLLSHLEIYSLPDDFTISINISAVQFRTQNLEQRLLKTLSAKQISPQKLTLEITETTLLDKQDDTIRQIKTLKNNGFKFSIDDFGTGYSSLAYLHSFPISELKIDRCFTHNLQDKSNNIAIIDAIASMSKHLNFSVIAEGVENIQDAELLAQRDIKGMQGFLYGHPMTANDFLQWLNQKVA
ncbi:MAG: EAL domain-containing protein [Pseudomonadales bacterium]|nr:EAL domain-containing protein [Pseudomonadales bacterium]